MQLLLRGLLSWELADGGKVWLFDLYLRDAGLFLRPQVLGRFRPLSDVLILLRCLRWDLEWTYRHRAKQLSVSAAKAVLSQSLELGSPSLRFARRSVLFEDKVNIRWLVRLLRLAELAEVLVEHLDRAASPDWLPRRAPGHVVYRLNRLRHVVLLHLVVQGNVEAIWW